MNDEIWALHEFQNKTYGEALDRSAADTAKMINDYYKFDKFEVKYDSSLDDLLKELFDGHLVIVPADVNAPLMSDQRTIPRSPSTNRSPKRRMLCGFTSR